MSFPRPASPNATPLSTLADLAGGELAGPDALVSGVTLDSRDVAAGDLYAALPGATAHGASYAAGAAELGAVAVLTDRAGREILDDAGVDLPVVVVEQPRSVVGVLASRVFGTGDLALTTYGITGTNGKTTTAYLVDSALRALGRRTGLIGTVETRIGDERIRSVRTTPEAPVLHALLAVMAERGLDDCVMEVSSHALVQHRVDGVVYDLALFTNLSQDHLDFHPTMRDYFLAKASLFTPARSRRGLVCVDDEWGRELAATTAEVPVTTLTSRTDVEADWRLTVDPQDPARFVVGDGRTTLRLRSALPGDFNRVNTAMAALALVLTGTPADRLEEAMAQDPHVPGRMEPVAPTDTGAAPTGLPLVVVDYAHTPDAVAAALAALRASTGGALVVVLGAGGDRDRGKRDAMGRAAAEGADIVFVTDDNPRSEDPAQIRRAVLAGAQAAGTTAQLHDVGERAEAIRRAVRSAHGSGPGSVVAVVGKGHETGQEVAGTVQPFDDRDVARAALDELVAAGGPA